MHARRGRSTTSDSGTAGARRRPGRAPPPRSPGSAARGRAGRSGRSPARSRSVSISSGTASYTLGNATTSTPAGSPSSRNCAYGSPRFVYFRASAPMMPPTVTSSPSPEVREVADLVGGLRRQRLLDPEQRMVGHELPEHLLLLGEEQRACRAPRRPAPTRRPRHARRLSPPPNSENWPAASALRSARIGRRHLLERWLSSTLEHPAARVAQGVERAGVDRATRAPASSARAGSTRRQKSANDVNGPSPRAPPGSAATTPSPTLRTADSP